VGSDVTLPFFPTFTIASGEFGFLLVSSTGVFWSLNAER